MFWLVEKLGGYETDLETVIATFMFLLSIFALIGVGTCLWAVWRFVL